MVYSSYSKLRILQLWKKGKRAPTINALLRREGFKATRKGVDDFIKQFKSHGTIHRLVNSLAS